MQSCKSRYDCKMMIANLLSIFNFLYGCGSITWYLQSTILKEPTDNLNLSYAGFIIAVFGAVPLIVGTFVEVPALWEIGLGVTLVGLFIGVLFWCKELCAEAKRFSQTKNQLSSRGKLFIK